MKKQKICYIVTIPATVNAFFIPQLKYLEDNGYNVTVICQEDEDLRTKLKKINYIPINIPRGIDIFKMFCAFFKLLKVFHKYKFDMIQYSTPNASFLASIAGYIAGIRIRNYHMMGIRYLGFKGIPRQIFKIVEKITCLFSSSIECVSKSNLKLCVQERLFKQHKGTVVWNGSTGGINLKRFQISKRNEYRYEIRSRLEIPDSAFVFGFVGRITKDKGINEIFQAFESIDDKAILFFIGSKEGIETIDPQLYDRALKNPRILFLDAVQDIEKYYAALDVLLLPSYREGFGNVVIEAAAMGTPAIVTKIPGPTDASIRNKTAFWVKKNDYNSLFRAMKFCLDNPRKIDEMKIECVHFAKDNFDQEILNEKILERKKNLLKDRF